MVKPGANIAVDTVQAYLEFDPDKLQVTSLVPGHRLEYHLASNWDNGPGRATFAAGTLGPAVDTPFMLLALTFNVTPTTGAWSTQVRFSDLQPPRRTRVIYRGLDITGELAPLVISAR